MRSVDFAGLKSSVQLSSVIGQSLSLKRVGREWIGCCPFHSERTPSFTVNDEKGFGHCFGCGWHGDGVDFVAELAGCSLREAAARLGAGKIPSAPGKVSRKRSVKAELVDAARRIWREAAPIAGTPAEAYLRGRHVTCELPHTLRFTRLRHHRGGEHPCLVAIVTSYDGKFAGIQRTYLSEDGHKAELEPVKMSLGRIAGCAIRLAPAAEELIVCEGVEDGLSVQQEFGRAVWVAAGASMLPSMVFPSTARSVVIAADNDTAGEREARKAAALFVARGLKVRIIRPLPGHKDFNAELQGARS